MSRTLIYNVQLCDASGIRKGFVAIDGTRIESVGEGTPSPDDLNRADTKIDAEGAMLVPGLIDTHVHFREPGLEYKATILSESRAAAAGGITAVFDMPNTVPPTVNVEALSAKAALAARECHTRYMPLLGIVPGVMKELANADTDAMCAVKLFLGTSTGGMRSPLGDELADVFRFCAERGLRIIVHAEDNAVIDANMQAALARYGSAERIPVSLHPEIRSRQACLSSASHAVELAHRFGARLHIAHVSTADEVRELLQPGKPDGKLVTAETTPLYLDPVLAEARARTSLHKVNPAIKTPADAEALRQALQNDTIDTIGTDHAPHLREEKMRPGMTAMSGAPSVQFALPMMLTYLPPETMVAKMTAGPCSVFGLGLASALIPDLPADLALIREVPEYTISDADVLSPCGWTPFAGRTVRHKVAATWINGHQTFKGNDTVGTLATEDIGIPLRPHKM